MKKKAKGNPPLAEFLRERALRYPETEEGIACAGTSLEKRTIKVRGKAFLFLGPAEAMLKLADSLPEAQQLAARAPETLRTGAGGWITFALDQPKLLPRPLLTRWLEESFRLLAPKKLLATLDEPAPATKGRKRKAE